MIFIPGRLIQFFVMPVKIRLQRHGRKKRPFYFIVVADARAPRDGRFIERIGSFNPMVEPPLINIDIDTTLDWLSKGAQPTNTARSILSKSGVMYKKHLQRGVAKGAFNQEEADRQFMEWMRERSEQTRAQMDATQKAKADKVAAIEKAQREAREGKANAAMAEAKAAEEAAAAEAAASEAVASEESADAAGEAVAEAPATEEAPAAEESPAAEETPAVAEEPAPVEESKEAAAPAEESAAETAADVAETPAEEPAQVAETTSEEAEAPKAEDAASDESTDA